MKVVFPCIAQPHQIAHGFPIAAELASRSEFQVHIACTTDAQEALIRHLLTLYPEARLRIDRLKVGFLARWLQRIAGRSLPPKRLVLMANRGYFKQFDAAAVSERTSLVLKKLGLPKLRLIWTQHGPPGRAITYAPDIRKFDFVMISGQTQLQRMLDEGLTRPGAYHVGSYAKFDLVTRLAADPPRLFSRPRPVVLYAPHFEPGLSSWPDMGLEVLSFFAKSEDYNLIFAPHVRLFDHRSDRLHRQLDHYRQFQNLHIDTGSQRSIDMSYTQAADIYLGDVSSQVCEFLLRPRPCIFLNAHGVDWRDSPDYLFWHMGPVLDRLQQLPDALARAQSEHAQWQQAQQRYFSDCFSTRFDAQGRAEIYSSAQSAADAIAAFLKAALSRPISGGRDPERSR